MSLSKSIKKVLFHRITKNIVIFFAGFFVGAALIVSQNPIYSIPDWAIVTEEDTNSYPYRPTRIFNKRVTEEFPAGQHERRLIQALQKAGFQLDWYAPAGAKKATLITKRASCEIRREVVWATNSSNRLTGATGSYWEICEDEKDVNAAQ